MADEEDAEGGGAESLLEWIAAAVGLALVVAGVWILVVSQVDDRAPPDIVVEAGSPEAAAGGWRVRLRITNEGGQAAEDVRVAAELVSGEFRERREATAAFLGPRSTEEAAVIFRFDPAAGRMDVWVESYGKP